MRITYQMIKDLGPCPDRWANFTEHYPYFNGDLDEFLALEDITFMDKLWVLSRLVPEHIYSTSIHEYEFCSPQTYMSAVVALVENYYLTKEQELSND